MLRANGTCDCFSMSDVTGMLYMVERKNRGFEFPVSSRTSTFSEKESSAHATKFCGELAQNFLPE